MLDRRRAAMPAGTLQTTRTSCFATGVRVSTGTLNFSYRVLHPHPQRPMLTSWYWTRIPPPLPVSSPLVLLQPPITSAVCQYPWIVCRKTSGFVLAVWRAARFATRAVPEPPTTPTPNTSTAAATVMAGSDKHRALTVAAAEVTRQNPRPRHLYRSEQGKRRRGGGRSARGVPAVVRGQKRLRSGRLSRRGWREQRPPSQPMGR